MLSFLAVAFSSCDNDAVNPDMLVGSWIDIQGDTREVWQLRGSTDATAQSYHKDQNNPALLRRLELYQEGDTYRFNEYSLARNETREYPIYEYGADFFKARNTGILWPTDIEYRRVHQDTLIAVYSNNGLDPKTFVFKRLR